MLSSNRTPGKFLTIKHSKKKIYLHNHGTQTHETEQAYSIAGKRKLSQL
jgi:hypothetical protein